MQTRCRHEIFLVCYFCCKNNTCAFVALQILTLYAEDFFAKRLVCELPPVPLRISVIEFVKIDIGKHRGERFPPCGEPSFVFITMPFSIAPLLRYFLMRSISLLFLISSRSIFISCSWLSVSKHLDRSKHTAYLYPSSAYSFTFGMASFALLCGL